MAATKYRELPDGVILLGDNISIPPDPKNREYRRYLDWEKKGNKADKVTWNTISPTTPGTGNPT